MTLAVSLLALLAGPLLVLAAGQRRSAKVFLDAFVLVAVGGLVLLHVLPDAITRAGLWGLVAAGLGVVLPLWIERAMRPGGAVKAMVIAFALLGMGLHATLDGVALTAEDEHHGDLLALAVILHRIPVGIGIWWLVGRTLGRMVAIAMLAVVAIGTTVGYEFGGQIWTEASIQTAGLLEALLCGSLLHVLLHSDVPAPAGAVARRGLNWASVGGMLTALFVLRWVVGHSHAHVATGEDGHSHGEGVQVIDHGDHVHVIPAEEPPAEMGGVFLSLLVESMPILFLAYLAVGFLHVFLPASWVDRMNAKSVGGQALRGMAVGIPLPVCSCAVVPIYRGLIQKGAATAAATSFLIATPELELAAIFLTTQLMGFEFAIARLVAAAVLALSVGVLIGVLAKRRTRAAIESELEAGANGGEESCCASEETATASEGFGARVRRALRFGSTDAVDDTLPWVVFGLGVSAVLYPYFDAAPLGDLPAWGDVPLAALLGLPIYVCASGSTPIAAILLLQGLSPGAVLAFLLTGPATNATTFGVVAKANGRSLAWVFTGSMLACSILLGYAVNLALPQVSAKFDPAGHEHATGGAMAWIAYGLFVVLVLGSVARLGVRGFIGKLFRSPGGHAHDHGHSHDHGHGDEHSAESDDSKSCCH